MHHRVAKDMISSGMIPSGEKKKEDLGRPQYGTVPSPNALADAYKSMYDKKEEVINEHHQKDKDGNTIPHEDEEIKEGAGLYANIHAKRKRGGKMRKKGAKGAPSSQDFANAAKTAKEDLDLFDVISDKLIEEGYSKKESYKIMSNLTEEQLEEIKEAVVSGSLGLGALGAGILKGMIGAGKAAAVAGKGLASAGKAAAVKGMGAAKTAAVTGAKKVASAAQTGMSKASDALGKVSNIAKDKAKGMGDTMTNIGKSVKDDIKNEVKRKIIQGDDGGSNKISKTGTMSTGSYQAASADLFDIVKGQLLDEGLSEEEIKDIMLTLTPDEIMEELSDVVKRNDALNRERAIKAAQERKVPQDIRDKSKKQYKAGTPRESPNDPYTKQDAKDIRDYYNK